jgi:hypothetical protein
MKWTPRMRLRAIAMIAAAVVLSAGVAAQQIRTARQMPFPQKPDWAALEVETLHVQGQVHLIAGAGGNVAVQAGDEKIMSFLLSGDKEVL